MTTYNTGNPVGSAAVKDLYDNAENLDVAINSQTAGEWTDRLGNARKTWKGIEDKAEIDIAASASAAAASASAAAAGYRDETLAARNDAQAAASAIGPVKFFDTKAQADAAIVTLANGDIIEVSQDETRAGARTRYKVQAGALVFVVNLDQTKLDLAAASGAGMVGYLPEGVGAVATHVQSKLRETVSVRDFGAVGDGVTSDQTAVAAAVAHCHSSGEWLYWPDGTYLTTASIANFHNIRHRGPGALARGSSNFYPDARSDQTNILYVSVSGNDANDGITSSQPVRTIQRAVDCFLSLKSVSNRCRIILAAGTYNEAVKIPDYQAQSNGFFSIEGPLTATVQTTPTAIIDGSAIAANAGVSCGFGNKVQLTNLLYTNWTGGTDAVIASTGTYVWLLNNQSLDGTARSLLLVDRSATALVQGGGKVGGQIGFDCYSGSTLTIGYNSTSLANSTFVRNTTLAGVYCKSHVHIVSNYVDYTDNVLVVLGYHNARFDTKGDNFKRNTRVFRMQGGFISENLVPTSVYNYGTADANTIVFELDQFSGLDLYHAGGRGGLDVAHQRQSTTITGTAAATQARALKTIEGYQLTTPGRYAEVECVVAGTGSANTKTVQLHLGSTVIGTFTIAAGTVAGKFRTLIWANNNTSVVVINEVTNLTLVTYSLRTSAVVDMTVNQILAVSLTVPGTSDTAVLHEARCVLWG